MPDRIDQERVGQRYADWFTTGLGGIGMRYVFSRRGLWLINTPFRKILGAAAIGPEDRLLDLGCGIGNLLIALSEWITFRHAPVGVDISPALIEIGRREVKKAGFDGRVELRVSPATRLPLADQSFDVVITSHLIKHLDDASLDAALAEVYRVLAPGGRFLLWEFKKSPFSAPLFVSARATGLPPPFTLRTEPTLARSLSGAGFHRVSRVPTGLFLMPPVPRLALLAIR